MIVLSFLTILSSWQIKIYLPIGWVIESKLKCDGIVIVLSNMKEERD